MSLHICMIDSSDEQTDVVKQYFSKLDDYEFVATTNLDEILNKYIESDILIIDSLIPGTQMMTILSSARERTVNQKIIVTSEYSSHELMKIVNKYNVNYFLKKPYKEDELFEIIKIVTNNYDSNKTDDYSLKVAITDMLHNLGIPSHIRGYAYIRDGISMMYKNENMVGSITKELYPYIAEIYNTTSSRVERAIRHAIEVSWSRGDYELMENLFGNSVDYDRAKPTNSEFIATVADRLKLEREV